MLPDAPSLAARRSYFSSSIEEFCSADADAILAEAVRRNDFPLTDRQRDAWLEQIAILKPALVGRHGRIYLEFTIPRLGSRVDVIAVVGPVIFVIEFKVGEREFRRTDIDQVTDYALDLRNFHESSHRVAIAPILVCTQAPADYVKRGARDQDDSLLAVALSNAAELRETIDAVLDLISDRDIDHEAWAAGRYRPTPTIVEATLALYRGHEVAEITRSDAGATNLTSTAQAVEEIIQRAITSRSKHICFVTGVPGAGKTLVGLNAAAKHLNPKDSLYSVFLSGNQPLVSVLQEALARDRIRGARAQGKEIKKGRARSEVKGLIQNIHHFRDDCLKDPAPPLEHVAIFDEAQRAWDLRKTADFMKRRKGTAGFDRSEPEYLISCLDRHSDWAVVVCLVGGGQEIHDGEAGIREWLESLGRSFQNWRVHISDRLGESEYEAEAAIEDLKRGSGVELTGSLHLATSVRSFRSEAVSHWVKALLDLDAEVVSQKLADLRGKYPIALTRDLQAGRQWLRDRARGSERYGIVVSSQAQRLRPYAVDVRTPVNPVHWFLNGRDDVRSSYYLEDVATEFQVQGLELDWSCVVWDADFRHRRSGWDAWSFKGSKWQKIHKKEHQTYLKNAYRVLLTRARQGMVVVVPEGDRDDATRSPEFYDATYRYLRDSGLQEI